VKQAAGAAIGAFLGLVPLGKVEPPKKLDRPSLPA
jgi:hypothetical protein